MLSQEGISRSQERQRQGEVHPNKGLKNSLKSLFLSSNLEFSLGNKESGKSPVWKREGEMEPGCRANQLLILSMAAFTAQDQRPCDQQTLKCFLSGPYG